MSGSVGAILLVAGCHSTQTFDEPIPPNLIASRPVSVYPATSIPTASQKNPSNGGLAGNSILPEQVVEIAVQSASHSTSTKGKEYEFWRTRGWERRSFASSKHP